MFSAGSLTAVVALLSLVAWAEGAHFPAGKIDSVTGQSERSNEIRGKSSSSIARLAGREALNCCVLNYTVAAGDTCDAIALAHTINISVLQTLNPNNCTDSDSANLVTGGVLCLEGFPTAPSCTKQYSVASGDSCSSIALANHLTLAQLQNLNPVLGNDGKTCPIIFPGEVFCVAGTPQQCPGTGPTSSSTAVATTATSAMSSLPGAITSTANSSTKTDIAATVNTSCTSSTTLLILPPIGIIF